MLHFKKEIKMQPWTLAHVNLLGTVPDSTIARIRGTTISPVAFKRKNLGIPACNSKRSAPWTPELLALFGTMPDRKIAQLRETVVSAVTSKRRTTGTLSWRGKRLQEKLNSITDEELRVEASSVLARRYHVSPSTISAEREKRGFFGARTNNFRKEMHHAILEFVILRYGKIHGFQTALSKILCVSVPTVNYWVKKLREKAFERWTKGRSF
jgi:hypothetical protein